MRKKLLALLLAAALAISLLAGCGGGESVASALLKLLDGRYPNISIEIDHDLEADLRQAIRKAEAENAGDDAAVIRAALETALGSTITFRNLRNGQKGETAFDLVFYAGSDPDKAAQAAYSQWNPILSNVPADGQYDTSLAMVETNSGVWMLVKATVEKAGTVEKPDSEPEPEPEEPKTPYTLIMNDDNTAISEITIGTTDGFNHVFFGDVDSTGGDETEENALKTARSSGFKDVIITLEAGQTYTVSAQFAENNGIFMGTLQGGNKQSTFIKLTGDKGLFQQIGEEGNDPTDNGKVQDITFNVEETISVTYTAYHINFAGPVAGQNNGIITNCDVTISSGSSITLTATSSRQARAGGIVGQNSGEISSCTVTGGTVQANGCPSNTGGIAGRNINKIDSCTVTDVTIEATSSSGAFAGGLVGNNRGEVNGTYQGSGEIKAMCTGNYSATGNNNGSGPVSAEELP